ncbi:MAG TPA: hypothetical protein VLA37_03390 [Sphingomonadaceae bacterium]|nr:hypothetical protein [Sphingomonadaceae bacterium]
MTVPAIAAFAAGMLACTPAQAQDLAFVAGDSAASDTGHILVEWEAPGEAVLIIAGSPDFADGEALYQGSNKAYFLSGLEGGEYYLMLRDDEGRQSEALHLAVEHQSLARAYWLTLIGAIITLATVAVIFRGARP